MFCQLELQRQCFLPSVRQVLEELPEGLDGTYERVLKEIKKANQKHTHRLLQCLAMAVRPLRVDELAEVLTMDFNVEGTPKLNPDWRWVDPERAVKSAGSSLVAVVNNGDSQVAQFSHFSVKEFLMSSRLAESSGDISHYRVSLEPAHTIFAQACLGVLLQLDDHDDHDSIGSFPLAQYAAKYWVKHARFENVSPQIADEIDCLFDGDKPHFATWLWIYNEDHQYTYGMQSSQHKAVPLYHAAMLGLRDLVERLLAKRPEDLEAEVGFKVTPLHASAAAGHTDVFLLLIEHLPDVDIRGRWDQTPLHIASWNGRLEIRQWLLSYGADANARNNSRETPLYLAVWKGELEFA